MDRAEIAALAERTGFPKISLYFPTHRKGRDVQQNPIRLKNAIARAAADLERAGWRRTDVDALLAAARGRTRYDDFWLHQGEALAVFIDGDAATAFQKLPERTDEVVVVADRFHLRPLIRMFGWRNTGHLLTVTREAVGLYDVSRHGIRRVEVEAMPRSIAEIREQTDFDADVGFHANVRGSVAGGGDVGLRAARRRATGGAQAIPQYHGLGPSPQDYDEVQLLEFLRQVAHAVDDHLAGSARPLVLAAEPRTYGHLRPMLRYRWTVEEGLKVNPAALSEAELHEKGWAALARHLDEDRDALMKRLEAGLGTGATASRDLAALARAAMEGRLAAVFLEPGARRWGRYDPERDEVALTSDPGPGAEDLIDFIAVRTLRTGGAVYTLLEGEAERLGPVAGIFRY